MVLLLLLSHKIPVWDQEIGTPHLHALLFVHPQALHVAAEKMLREELHPLETSLSLSTLEDRLSL